jgi:hypothetical protein
MNSTEPAQTRRRHGIVTLRDKAGANDDRLREF